MFLALTAALLSSALHKAGPTCKPLSLAVQCPQTYRLRHKLAATAYQLAGSPTQPARQISSSSPWRAWGEGRSAAGLALVSEITRACLASNSCCLCHAACGTECGVPGSRAAVQQAWRWSRPSHVDAWRQTRPPHWRRPGRHHHRLRSQAAAWLLAACSLPATRKLVRLGEASSGTAALARRLINSGQQAPAAKRQKLQPGASHSHRGTSSGRQLRARVSVRGPGQQSVHCK